MMIHYDILLFVFYSNDANQPQDKALTQGPTCAGVSSVEDPDDNPLTRVQYH